MLNREGRKEYVARFWDMILTSGTHGVSHIACMNDSAKGEGGVAAMILADPKLPSSYGQLLAQIWWRCSSLAESSPLVAVSSELTLEVVVSLTLKLSVLGLLHISYPLFDIGIEEAYFFNRSRALIP
jgi:hypothetical protein